MPPAGVHPDARRLQRPWPRRTRPGACRDTSANHASISAAPSVSWASGRVADVGSQSQDSGTKHPYPRSLSVTSHPTGLAGVSLLRSLGLGRASPRRIEAQRPLPPYAAATAESVPPFSFLLRRALPLPHRGRGCLPPRVWRAPLAPVASAAADIVLRSLPYWGAMPTNLPLCAGASQPRHSQSSSASPRRALAPARRDD